MPSFHNVADESKLKSLYTKIHFTLPIDIIPLFIFIRGKARKFLFLISLLTEINFSNVRTRPSLYFYMMFFSYFSFLYIIILTYKINEHATNTGYHLYPAKFSLGLHDLYLFYFFYFTFFRKSANAKINSALIWSKLQWGNYQIYTDKTEWIDEKLINVFAPDGAQGLNWWKTTAINSFQFCFQRQIYLFR